MTTGSIVLTGLKGSLARKEAELVHELRSRDGIAIAKSPDLMDEIQSASERDLAIRMADRGSSVLGLVRAALQRVRDGSIGTCADCKSEIGPKRLAALPWASRCIACQEAADEVRPAEAGLGPEAFSPDA